MKLIQLEKRLGRWMRTKAGELWATLIVTPAVAGLGVAAQLTPWTTAGKLAADVGLFLVWGLILGVAWLVE